MQKIEYTHQLPYSIRSSLCNVLDADQSWQALGGKLGLDATQLSLLGQAYLRLNGSPASELLNKIDSSNIRIIDLCHLLSQLCHWRAVEILKPYENQNASCDSDTNMTLVTPTPSFEGTAQIDRSHMMDLLGRTDLNSQINWTSENSPRQVKLPIESVKNYEYDKQKTKDTDQRIFKNDNLKRLDPNEAKVLAACSSNKHRTSITDQELVNQLRLIMQINYKELKIASDDFSSNNIIGNGGFASVYRGNLKGTEVAIKRLKCNLVDQALNELTIMNSYRIDNILPIYGISIDGPEACLVYQYMSNGSLEDRLACKNDSPPLTWKQRALIGEGLAKGLYYLHTLREKPLVHGDVKSANVLLDSQFVPKLGDFGLARQVYKGMSGKEMLTHCTVSSINGTSVYLPAEYLRHRILSPAVDVYSYGIVLLEMGTGKRAYDGKRLLIDRVEDETSSISSGQMDLTLKDHRVLDSSQSGLKIWYELMIKLGLECAHRIKKKRLDMGQVLERYSNFWLENQSNEIVGNSTPDSGRTSRASTLRSDVNYIMNQATPRLLEPIQNNIINNNNNNTESPNIAIIPNEAIPFSYQNNRQFIGEKGFLIQNQPQVAIQNVKQPENPLYIYGQSPSNGPDVRQVDPDFDPNQVLYYMKPTPQDQNNHMFSQNNRLCDAQWPANDMSKMLVDNMAKNDITQTNSQQAQTNQVDAMIPLLTELGIDGDHSDRDN